MDATDAAAWIVLGRDGVVVDAVSLDDDAQEIRRARVDAGELTDWVAAQEAACGPRWVWSDSTAWYPPLLAAGVRVARCHDLRLCHAIVRDAASVGEATALRAAVAWDRASTADAGPAPAPTLFDLDDSARRQPGPPMGVDDAIAEFRRQRAAVAASADPSRLRLLLAAESVGGLIGVELREAGLPWDAAAHDVLLTEALGPRPVAGAVPERMEDVAREVRRALGDPSASLDSQQKLLRSLHRVGVLVESTSKWELVEQRHPVIEPLLEYKRLARLYTANGWAWLDEWVA